MPGGTAPPAVALAKFLGTLNPKHLVAKCVTPSDHILRPSDRSKSHT